MTTVTADRTLAEVVTADPAATRVFESYALDYCCGGRRRIDEACATAGVDVVGAHGTRHPELLDVAAAYAELRAELTPHLAKEEQALFPMIRELASSEAAPAFPCGSLSNPISVMLVDHDRAGELLAILRTLTDGYETPADGCASYRVLYDGLAELEADTHLHVHKENNLLFPAVVALEDGRRTPA